jgi:hypothetical protein
MLYEIVLLACLQANPADCRQHERAIEARAKLHRCAGLVRRLGGRSPGVAREAMRVDAGAGGLAMCKHGEFDTLLIDHVRVDVDRCIAPLVDLLNVNGFKTVASCCGHGHRPGRIALADGRELIIARNYEDAARIDALFPLDIHGEPLRWRPA